MSAKPTTPEPPHLVNDLKELKLPSIVQHWERLTAEAERRRQPHAEYLAELTHQEVCDRRERAIRRRIGDARFPRTRSFTTPRQPRPSSIESSIMRRS